jgi:putative acetyltransferase
VVTGVEIRAEEARDAAAIREVHLAAFAHHPFSHQTEHLIVEVLRAAGALCISLVAEVDGKVVGNIAFSSVTIGGQEWRWYALGPVGVLPAVQRQGIGSTLVRHGLERLCAPGANGCVLVGEPSFYRRFGFRQCATLTMPGIPAEVLQCLVFAESEPAGPVEHHPAFRTGMDGQG